MSSRSRGHFQKAYELIYLEALRFALFNKLHIFQCIGKILWVEFQRVPLKFHTKYLTHTLKDEIFIQCWRFKSSYIWGLAHVFKKDSSAIISIERCHLTCLAIAIIKIRRFHSHIFIIGIPTPEKTIFILRWGPDLLLNQYCISILYYHWPCYNNSCLYLYIYISLPETYSIGHVTPVAFNGTIFPLPCIEIKALQLIWRFYTCRFHLQVPNLQMIRKDLTTWQGTRTVFQWWPPCDLPHN